MEDRDTQEKSILTTFSPKLAVPSHPRPFLEQMKTLNPASASNVSGGTTSGFREYLAIRVTFSEL